MSTLLDRLDHGFFPTVHVSSHTSSNFNHVHANGHMPKMLNRRFSQKVHLKDTDCLSGHTP